MGRLVVNMFVTLDGVVQSPGMPEEDTEGGFPHGGWQVPFFNDELDRHVGQGMTRMDALLLGRKTYDIFAGYWPKAPADDRFAIKLNAVPKYVASRTLDEVDWNNSSLIEGDLAKAIEHIKAEHNEVHTFGSSDLMQSLLRLGLIDSLTLFVYPIVLGTGKRLFREGAPPTAFKLVESRPFNDGAVLMTYEPAGKPTYGTTALEDQPQT